MNNETLLKNLRNVPDFPVPGIQFKDVSTLYKNAKTALKNQSGQDAARDALLGAVNRTELNNKKRADIYFTAALLEESLNGIENRKAFLKQPYDMAKFFNKLCDMYGQLRLCDSIDING